MAEMKQPPTPLSELGGEMVLYITELQIETVEAEMHAAELHCQLLSEREDAIRAALVEAKRNLTVQQKMHDHILALGKALGLER